MAVINQELKKGAALEQAPNCRIILVPRSVEKADASWEVADTYKQIIRDQRGQRLMVRVYDVTNLNLDHAPS